MIVHKLLDPADFGPRETAATLQSDRIEPELGDIIAPFNVYVGRLMAITCVKEEPIGTDEQNGGHRGYPTTVSHLLTLWCAAGQRGGENWRGASGPCVPPIVRPHCATSGSLQRAVRLATHLRRASFIRVCQPAPVDLKYSSTSGLYRTLTNCFVGVCWGPR